MAGGATAQFPTPVEAERKVNAGNGEGWQGGRRRHVDGEEEGIPVRCMWQDTPEIKCRDGEVGG